MVGVWAIHVLHLDGFVALNKCIDGLWLVIVIEVALRWNLVLNLDGKVKKTKGSAAENFPQEPLDSLRKSVISWCRKAGIEFRLLRLKLDSDCYQPCKFHNFSQFLWISMIFQSWLNLHTCSVFWLDEAANLGWNLTDLWSELYKGVF